MRIRGKPSDLSPAASQDHPEAGQFLPKVSVAMITYNHEKFIAQAVESVMMQQTDFDYELMVGEDCSTDNTRMILLQLQKQFPKRLKLLLHERNLGMRENFKQTLHACRGQYLAVLQGDDYWTSNHKLQKQADALDKNPDWSICCYRNIAFYEDGSKPPYLWPPINPKPVSTLDDLVSESFVGTCTAIYRREAVERYPDWMFQVEICDYALNLFYAQYGKIGFIDEVMSAYRRHVGGTWSQRDMSTQRTILAHNLRIIAHHMGWQHRRSLESQAAKLLLAVVTTRLADGTASEARKVMNTIFPGAYCLPRFPWRRLSRTALSVYAPWIIPILRSVKWFVLPAKPVGRA